MPYIQPESAVSPESPGPRYLRVCWLDTARWPMPYIETATLPFSLQQGLRKQGAGGSLLDLYSKFVGLISDPPLSGDAHVVYAGG